MAAWSNPGSGRSVTTSSAHIRPCASAIATRTGRGATAAACTRACCSSTDRTMRLSVTEPGCGAPGPMQSLLLSQAQSRNQPAAQVRAVVITIQGKVNRSLEVPAGISQVVSRSAVHHDVDGMALVDEQRDGIGELDLAADPTLHAPQRVENRPVQNIAAGRGIERRRIGGLGLL